MANLLYRVSTGPAVPGSTSAKGTPLTNAEIDGNFKSINNDLADKPSLNGSYANPAWITSLAETKVLPSQTTHTGKYLTTNGTVTSWAVVDAGAKGGTGNPIFWENDQTISVNYTITSGKNAGTFGPVTVADGITVTIPADSVWTIV